MRQVTRKSLVSVAAAGGVLALASGTAYADSGAQGAAEGSPGVLSGNSVQVPVNVPVNLCGNTVSVIGLLNPAMGNQCANGTGAGTTQQQADAAEQGSARSDGGAAQTRAGGGTADANGDGGAAAQGTATGSPGVLSGNNVQVPVDVPINACGNSVNVVGIANPAFGNDCANVSTPQTPDKPAPEKPEKPTPEKPEKPTPEKPEVPEEETPRERVVEPHTEKPELAQTGSPALGAAAPVAVAMMLGGYVLFRRGRVGQN